ncbi:unnamed protein product [Gulo gulo]|uniref:Uncharacterized protein n=1 Tax=Gulo gulo TaxID=48420 RepID=A0A9X9M482_GULGU|nr:unnamed protein product [Gulo gulo]
MLSCLRPKCWEILFLYLFSHDENVAHSVVAKQVGGDMTFHTVFSLAANAKVASLWGPPCHPDSCSGFRLSMPALWFAGWSPLAHLLCFCSTGLRRGVARSYLPVWDLSNSHLKTVPSAPQPSIYIACSQTGTPRGLWKPIYSLAKSPPRLSCASYVQFGIFTEGAVSKQLHQEPSKGQTDWQAG